jgi:hypothetical protein
LVTTQVVGGNEKFIGAKFGGAVEVNRSSGFVGGEGYNLTDFHVDTGLDDILRSEDVGFDALKRVVFGHRNLFESGSVNHGVHAVQSVRKPVSVANVTNEKAQTLIRELLGHFILLEFIPRVDDHPLDIGIPKEAGNAAVAKGSGPAGDKQ